MTSQVFNDSMFALHFHFAATKITEMKETNFICSFAICDCSLLRKIFTITIIYQYIIDSVRESKRLKYKILQNLHANQVTLKNEKSANHYYTLVFK